jgi:hypothetical protein
MYRLLSASKDTYITDKIVSAARTEFANVGQAGTLDLFKLYGESTLSGTTNPIELSRILIKFDYSELDTTIVSRTSFTASVRLKDIYGGQTVPSNYTLALFPLSKSFDEGRGIDVVSYRDLDAANFLTSSTGVTWSQSGASNIGNMGADVDVMTSGNLGAGVVSLGVFQTFARGDEDGVFNVTSLVSASVAGILPNHGFRISYIKAEEDDVKTRFVKRFGSRHTFNKDLRPKLIAESVDRIVDNGGDPYFGITQSYYVYNYLNGNPTSFTSGGSDVSTLILEVAASKSIQFLTSSFQANFSASINHLTTSVVFYSQSFTGSAVSTGIYSASFNLDPTTNIPLRNFLSGANEFDLKGTWKSLDGTVTYNTTFFAFKKLLAGGNNAQTINYVVSAVNLKDEYTVNDQARIRVFVQDKDNSQLAFRHPTPIKPVIVPDMRWRLVKSFSNDVVIPFSPHTKMSTDKEGMYFDFEVQDLDLNEVYEFEFLIRNDSGKDVTIQNKGFIFKVIP